jgi:hypothetical protein
VNNTNNLSARASYDNAKRVLFNAWINTFNQSMNGDANIYSDASNKACQAWVDNRKLTQGYLRLEVLLTNNNNIYTFGVTTNQQNSSNILFPSERRLNLQDSMIVSEYGLYVGLPASNTDTNFKLHTYGNQQVWTAAQANGIDGELYSSGEFSLRVNGDVVVPARDLFQHLYLPQTQQTAPVGAGSPGDQLRGAEDGLVTDEPNLLIIGSKNNLPQITLHNNLVPDMGFTRAVLFLRGINAQNSTVIN